VTEANAVASCFTSTPRDAIFRPVYSVSEIACVVAGATAALCPLGYSQIEDALRNQYSIGYTPPRAAADGKYHKIKLTTKDHHLIVDTRNGYYAK
jgi:hypothetical protein